MTQLAAVDSRADANGGDDLWPAPLSRVGRAFDHAAIAWVRLRPSAVTNGRPSWDDEDLLVAAAQMPLAARTLRELGYLEFPAPGRGSHRFWWSYDDTARVWTKLDIVTELAYGPLGALRTTTATGCLQRRERHGQISVPSRDDAFWTLLLHDLFDRRSIPGEHRDHLLRLAPVTLPGGGRHPLASTLDQACPRGWDADRIVEHVARGDWRALEPVAAVVGRRWAAADPLGGRTRLAVRRLRRRLATYGVPPRRALSVALLGPDGSGKSTTVGTLGTVLPFPVEVVYLGLYRSGTPAGRLGTGLLRRVLFAWRGYLTSLRARARGHLVAFDRHPLEIRQIGNGSRVTRVRRWLLARAVPGPDFVLVLDAPADVLMSRRPEHPAGSIEDQRERYRRLAARTPNASVIDASAAPEAVLAEVVAAIWRRALERGGW